MEPVLLTIAILAATVGAVYFAIKDHSGSSKKPGFNAVNMLEGHKMVNPNPGQEWWQ